MCRGVATIRAALKVRSAMAMLAFQVVEMIKAAPTGNFALRRNALAGIAATTATAVRDNAA